MKEKILASYLDDFASQFGFDEVDFGRRFVHFVNHCMVSRLTSDTYDIADINVDGQGDTGIDGLAILVDGHIVNSKGDVDFFRDQLGRLDVQFVFIQSKTSPHFTAADVGTFLFGVRSFFDEHAKIPASEEIKNLRLLKDYIYQLTIHMENPPECLLYYVTTGQWCDDPNVVARADAERKQLSDTNMFSEVVFSAIDANKLKSVYRELRHKIVREVSFEKHTILPDIDGVKEAYLGILPCQDYLQLITDDEGEIQRGLFYDNVRDYQGDNPVNREISRTLSDKAANAQFVLLNNGVTIVAKTINKVGATFKITDYQIVNGCQTSHVLHRFREHLDSSVYLPVKLIVTDNPEITNRIIRGTNRQTEVLPEAFESLSPFHRTLEEFYSSFGKNKDKRLYYERRSKQYASLPVKPREIVTLALQSQAFLAMFLDEPHSTHRYYGEILRSNRGRLFSESHRPFPYYAAAYGLVRLQVYFNRGKLPHSFRKYKYHILMLLRHLVVGRSSPSLESKKIDDYCEKLCVTLWDDVAFLKTAKEAIKSIEHSYKTFTGDRYLSPRLRSFTQHIIPALPQRPHGVVKYYNLERGFGFVEVEGISDVFVHYTSIKGKLDRYLRVGDHVEFDIIQTERGPQAQSVKLFGD